jgi:photosystem II stability/assembly factor-like uncharacterized protein
MNPIRAALLSAVALASMIASGSSAQAAAGDPAQALRWRLIGPMRAGWSTVAQGIADQPDTYYFAAAGGGVWKTTDSGATWHSVFDAVPAANIGALAIAPGAPDTIYVGSGQVAARYDVGAGNGVYKSTDGGRTWAHVGLEATRHIGAVLVDPRNADDVLVAALGHYFGPNRERGVFRSADGGKTWQQTLFVDANTGAVDLAADPGNPDIVYAAAWQVRNYPWLSYFMPNAGPGSGLYRSDDAGRTWKRIAGLGWPSAVLGRIGVAAAGGGRVYAVVNAAPYSGNVAHTGVEDAGGLYRSDDDGANWRRVSSESWLENDYFGRITVDPSDRDRIYATGQSVRRSDDGGAHWTIFKGAPGGDDYHYIWINPKHGERMIVASDQGTAVSVNAGRTWSDWYNQPTGQFYHLAADNRFPYWIYSGQQDSGTVGAASRSAATNATTTFPTRATRTSSTAPASAATCRAGTRAPARCTTSRHGRCRATASARPTSGTTTPGSRRSRCRRCRRIRSTRARRCCSARPTTARPGARSARTCRRKRRAARPAKATWRRRLRAPAATA